jgi:predicted N-acetyltransferase YhbS
MKSVSACFPSSAQPVPLAIQAGHLVPAAEKTPAVAIGASAFGLAEAVEGNETGGGALFAIADEHPADRAARESLLDRAMGAGRKRKSSEKLRRGRLPARGLSLVARNAFGTVIGSVRLWHVAAGTDMNGHAVPALLLGPLAVDPSAAGQGIGSALMRESIVRARTLGHGVILLMGDPDYYRRFGFSAEKTAALAMPGPFEQRRLLALELAEGALDGAAGVLAPTGARKQERRAANAA